MILGQRKTPINFKRQLIFRGKEVILADELRIQSNIKFKKLSLGDEFFVRYVPQSRYFQSQELEISGDSFNQEKLNEINNTKIFYREKSLLNND